MLIRWAALIAAFSFCAAAQLRVGAAKRVITPDLEKHGPVYMAGFGQNRRATGVHDDLYVRCIALSAGVRPLAICGVDLIGVFLDDVRRIRASVPDADVVIAALHDHEGPDTMGLWGAAQGQSGIVEAYMSMITARIAETAHDAVQSMRPARIRLAKVKTPELDGFIDDTRPPVVHDAEIVALQAEGSDGNPIATLINWANHPETLGSRNTLITADYSGYLCKEAEARLGGTAVFINGAVGGMQSPLGAKVKDAAGKLLPETTFEKAAFIGTRVARLAAEALGNSKPVALDSLVFREKLVQIPMANQGFQMAAKAGVFAGRKAPNADGTTTTAVGYVRFASGTAPQLEIALIPGELYPELSVGGVERYSGADFPDVPVEPAIKQQMSAPYRMLFGLADDENGYIIPKSEWDEKPPFLGRASKAYYGEVNSLGPDAAPILTRAFQELLRGAK
jgi:hypothetical protein